MGKHVHFGGIRKVFRLYSKGCEYAIRAFMCIAPSGNRRFNAKEICQQAKIPESFTRKVLQSLAQAGFLEAVRGPGGGYVLTEEPSKISLLKLIRAVDGEGTFDNCILGLPQCDGIHPCPLHHVWSESKDRLLERLELISMQDLIDSSDARSVATQLKNVLNEDDQ